MVLQSFSRLLLRAWIIGSCILLGIGCSSTVRFASNSQGDSAPRTVNETAATTQKQALNTSKLDASEIRFSDSLSTEPLAPLRKRIVLNANKWIGTQYCYGGADKKCIDCSGLMVNIFKSVGVSLPRTSKEQWLLGNEVQIDRVQPGDLVFFDFTNSGVSHVGLYVGKGVVLHASTSKGVVRQPIHDTYLSKHLVGFKTFATGDIQ